MDVGILLNTYISTSRSMVNDKDEMIAREKDQFFTQR